MNPDFCAGIFAAAFLVIAGMGVWCAVEDIRTRKAETRQLQRENDRLDRIVAQAEGVHR